ncbi:coiled-coil domain-containing protein 125 isoform X1 [Larimichthys crocea]|uniref:coiled-coil domain-containing protein 125 isoform X1 n=2 Tax=Larimichthys crocea TaxID=215358 RepID=UPI000F5FD886|nr:coiled-coil domain-containing protein 125 isoform X1 [Larimichthys crocea]
MKLLNIPCGDVTDSLLLELTQFQMQEVSKARSLDDDMVDGDLGDGMGVGAAPSSTRKKSQSFAGVTETLIPGAEHLRRSSQTVEAPWIPGLKSGEAQHRARWKLSRSADSLLELSKEELKDRLQEASEVIDALCCELEVTHRYLEGKYEALRILQGKAILDKATSHTKSLVQKSEDRAKALEKEVNSLQWELSFSQVQMKRSQQSCEQKYNRILNENKTLTDTLEERAIEIQQLRAENSALSRQCLELLSMLNVKEQRTYQGTKPQYSLHTDSSVLELAVLGACRCLGTAEACPCSRTAAASRKQLIQLQQELNDQCSRREEALMVADAFRIAFEQQLRKRSEHFLRLAEANRGLKSPHYKAEGVKRSPLISVSQRLRGLLPSSLEVKMPDDLSETLYRLLDLLNDKEEALAHQRKVSIMLAHSAEELQRKLHLDSHCGPSENQCKCQQTPETSESNHESNIQEQQQQHLEVPDPSEIQSQCQQTSETSESNQKSIIQEQQQHLEVPDPSEIQSQCQQTSETSESNHESNIQEQQQQLEVLDPPEIQSQCQQTSGTSESNQNLIVQEQQQQQLEVSDPSENQSQCQQTSETSESNHESNIQEQQQQQLEVPDPSEIQSQCPQTSETSESNQKSIIQEQQQQLEVPDPSENENWCLQTSETQSNHKSNIQEQQQQQLEVPDPSKIQSQCQQTSETSESNHESNIQEQQRQLEVPDPPEIQSQCPRTSETSQSNQRSIIQEQQQQHLEVPDPSENQSRCQQTSETSESNHKSNIQEHQQQLEVPDPSENQRQCP